MENSKKIITLHGVNKVFDGTTVVDDFNLEITKGEFVTFLGPSGCGKTTTLRMIAGFEIPTSGSILLNGQDITKIPPYKRPINTVFQRYALFPYLDVYDNVAFGLKIKKIPYCAKDKKGNDVIKYRKLNKNEIDEKVNRALKIVDLEELEDRDITTLSGGQQQRVAIARAIVNEPEILLLDEPLGALDLKMRKDMQLELKEMHKRLGITFIYVTHDQEEALTMSDTIVVMKAGQIQQVGRPMDIYNEPKNAYVANFIGESNIYNATMVGRKLVKFLNHKFKCVDNFPINEKVDVVIRPEDVELKLKDQGTVNAVIVDKIFKGIHYEYTLMVGKSELIVQSTADMPLNIEVGVSVAPDNIHIMKKPFTSNFYDGYLTDDYKVEFAGGEFECNILPLFPGAKFNEDGVLVDAKGDEIDVTDRRVKVDVSFDAIEISDNLDDAVVVGNILSLTYFGDHYEVIVRTEDEDDFIVNTPDLWNENDKVSVRIAKDKINLKLATEDKK